MKVMRTHNTSKRLKQVPATENNDKHQHSCSSTSFSSSATSSSSSLYDVYFGRGNGVLKKPGNRNYRGIINAKKSTYLALKNNSDKNEIAKQIIADIRNLGGSFFHRPRGMSKSWVRVPEDVLLLKVKQALREIPKVRGARKKTETNIRQQDDKKGDHTVKQGCANTFRGDTMEMLDEKVITPYPINHPINYDNMAHCLAVESPCHATAGMTSTQSPYHAVEARRPIPTEQDQNERAPDKSKIAPWVLEIFKETNIRRSTRNTNSATTLGEIHSSISTSDVGVPLASKNETAEFSTAASDAAAQHERTDTHHHRNTFPYSPLLSSPITDGIGMNPNPAPHHRHTTTCFPSANSHTYQEEYLSDSMTSFMNSCYKVCTDSDDDKK